MPCADLGHGVDAALVDVQVLAECLDEHEDDVAAALALYERLRLPELEAMSRVLQVRYDNMAHCC